MHHIIISPPTPKPISIGTDRICNILSSKGKVVSIPLGISFSLGRMAYIIVHYITNNHKDGKYIHPSIKEED